MKKNLLLISGISLLISVFSCSTTAPYTETLMEKNGTNILMLMNENFGLNYMLMLDTMELKGWKLTHLGTSNSITPCYGIGAFEDGPFVPDYVFPEISDASGFDALIIPPGTGSYAPIKNPFGDIIDNPDIMNFITDTFNGGMPTFAMCMGVKVPIAAGLLENREAVTTNKLKNAVIRAGGKHLGADHPPVISDNLVTGVRGQYYNYQNMMALARAMEEAAGGKSDISAEAVRLSVTDAETAGGWEKTSIGTASADGARDGLVLNNGNILIGGYTFGRSKEDPDGLIIMLNENQEVVWTRAVGGTGSDYINSVCAEESDLYFGGYTTSTGAGSRDLLLGKFNINGELLWSTVYGGAAWEVCTDLIMTEEGPLCYGFTATDTAGEEDLLLVQFDREGNAVREKRYGGKRSEISAGIIKSENGFFLSAVSGSFNKNSDFRLIETAPDGEIINDSHYQAKGAAGHGFDWTTGIFMSPENKPILLGYSDSRVPTGAWLIAADTDGTILFNKGYKNSEFYNFAVDGFSDGKNIRLIGTRRDRNLDGKIFMLQIDPEGNLLEEEVFDSPEKDWASRCLQLPDGSLLLIGQCGTGGPDGDYNILLGKI